MRIVVFCWLRFRGSTANSKSDVCVRQFMIIHAPMRRQPTPHAKNVSLLKTRCPIATLGYLPPQGGTDPPSTFMIILYATHWRTCLLTRCSVWRVLRVHNSPQVLIYQRWNTRTSQIVCKCVVLNRQIPSDQ